MTENIQLYPCGNREKMKDKKVFPTVPIKTIDNRYTKIMRKNKHINNETPVALIY